MPTHRSRRALVAVAVLALLAAGCGDDDDGDDAAPATTTTSTAAEPDDDAGPVEVTALDYEFDGIDAELAAGTTLSLTNASDAELHELVAFRLPDDEERTADELVQLSEDELGALFAGPPTMVLIAPPSGAPMIPAVGDGTLSEPGRYLFLCSIPTGADPAEYMAAAQASQGGPPDVEGGPPHFTRGMYAEATVS
jgi:hypothetical protein